MYNVCLPHLFHHCTSSYQPKHYIGQQWSAVYEAVCHAHNRDHKYCGMISLFERYEE